MNVKREQHNSEDEVKGIFSQSCAVKILVCQNLKNADESKQPLCLHQLRHLDHVHIIMTKP